MRSPLANRAAGHEQEKTRRISEPVGAKGAASRRTQASITSKGVAAGHGGQRQPRQGFPKSTLGAASQHSGNSQSPRSNSQLQQASMTSRGSAQMSTRQSKHGPGTRADVLSRLCDSVAAEHTAPSAAFNSAKLIMDDVALRFADKVNDEDDEGECHTEAEAEAMADAALHKSSELLRLASMQLWDDESASDGHSFTGMVTPKSTWNRLNLDVNDDAMSEDMSEASCMERGGEMAAIWKCLRNLEERLERGDTATSAFGGSMGAVLAGSSEETFLDGLTTNGSLRSPKSAANSLNNTWTSLPWSRVSTPPRSPRSTHMGHMGKSACSTGSLAKSARAAACGIHPVPQRAQLPILAGTPSSPRLLHASSTPDVLRTPSSSQLTGASSPRQVNFGLGPLAGQAWPLAQPTPAMLTRTLMQNMSVPKLSL